jgi:hypothetical protein
MSTRLTIEGQARAVFSFPWTDLKSWNDLVYLHKFAYLRFAQAQTQMGAELALAFMNQVFKARRTQVYLVEHKALVVVKIYLTNDGKVFDVTNPCIKHIQDGFTQQRIFPDDEWAFLPVTVFMFAGFDKANPRFEIEIHQLETLVINGKAQALPLGREKR